jgi:redox-sensitive bicupin YhaK (pirin superfamily)
MAIGSDGIVGQAYNTAGGPGRTAGIILLTIVVITNNNVGMLTIRPARERGHANHGWLDTHHTFSFGEFHDPAHMGFRHLRVINEDRVAPGEGFGTHPHRDMEIITYPLDGAIEHRDSLGSGSVIRPGDVQHMTAGTGVLHSEFNPSRTAPAHFLQIWIRPRRSGLDPSYRQRTFSREERSGGLCLVASPDGREGSLRIEQDVSLYASILDRAQTVEHRPGAGRHAWIQIARGAISVNGVSLAAGDGLAVSEEALLAVVSQQDGSEWLLFDLA